MEMMDLPGYIDSFRQVYEEATQDLQQRLAAITQVLAGSGGQSSPGADAAQGAGQRTRHGHHHSHDAGHWQGHHEGCEHGCRECDDADDCCCECHICDADIVVYARCGELRVIPIEIDNDTRRVRDDVTLEVSEVRSSGGRTLPWQVYLNPAGPLTIEPCSTTRFELLTHINCRDSGTGDPASKGNETSGQASKETTTTTKGADKSPPPSDHDASLLAWTASQRGDFGDVDNCEVGYVTIRVGGCLIRPIVVAIAVLPTYCDAYHLSCSCC
jgi:hypothetical protein